MLNVFCPKLLLHGRFALNYFFSLADKARKRLLLAMWFYHCLHLKPLKRAGEKGF